MNVICEVFIEKIVIFISPLNVSSNMMILESNNKCRCFAEKQPPEPADEYGPEDERLALHVLNQLDLVKEHVERRSLYAATQPNLDQGQLYMWVDMFPKELGAPAEPVDITPRKCQR